MLLLDASYLADLELDGLSPAEANLLLEHVYETLEQRVGRRLGAAMTDAQLDTFEAFVQRGEEEGALGWLEREFPNYADVVHDEFRLLQGELREMAPTILALSGRRA